MTPVRLFLITALTVCSFHIYSIDFNYNPEWSDVGYVYKYYVKGSQEDPDVQYLYIRDPHTLEVLLVEPELPYPSSYVEKIDLSTMMQISLTGEYLGDLHTILPMNFIYFQDHFSLKERTNDLYVEYMDGDGEIKRLRRKQRFSRIPTYSMDDRGLLLAYALRFANAKKSLTVGIRLGYVFDAEIRYIGEEKVTVPYGTQVCDKYEIAGKGLLAALFGKKAWVWLSKESPYYMVKSRNDNYTEPGFEFYEHHLVYRKPLLVEEWEAAKEELREKGSTIVPDVLCY